MVGAALLARRAASPGPGDQLVGSVHDAMKAVLRHAHPALEAERISMGQFWALHLVSSLQPASLSTVARHLSISAPAVCEKIDQLESAGLVVRHRSERDRRAVELSLTAKGRKVESRIWARIGDAMNEAAEDLPAEDVATAVRVFRELNRRLDRTPSGRGVAA
jgi:MarR family transcriptional regulator, organic hydroperoxide resistance regulator